MTDKPEPMGKFTRNVLTLVSGTTVAQAIPILLQLVLRRIYSFEDFAAMGVYLSITGILVVVSTLRYEMAIVLPRDDRESANLVAVSLIFTTLINLLFLVVTFVFFKPIVKLIGFPEGYGYWLYLVPLSAFLLSAYQSLNYWLIRKSAYRASSVNKLVRRSAEGAVQTVMGFMGKPAGLVAGDITGNLANVVSGIWQVRRHGFRIAHINAVTMRSMLSRYREFPLYQAFPALMNTASLLLPVIIVSHLFTPYITAQFDLSRMVMALPLALISVSLSQVLLQKSTEKRLAGTLLMPLINRIFRYLVFFSVPAMIFIILTGPKLFGLIFSADYYEAGKYARILILAFSAQFLVSPLSILFTSLERMRVAAIWQGAYFVCIVSLFFLKGVSIDGFIIIFTSITIVAYTVYYLLIRYIVAEHDRIIVERWKEELDA